VDGDTLSIRDVKYLGIDATTEDADELTAGVLLAAGRYQRDDGKRPAQPKKRKAAKAVQNVPIPLSIEELPSAPPVVSNPFPVVGIPVPESALIPAGVISLPAPASPASKEFVYPRPTGVWVRDIQLRGMSAPIQVSLKFAGDHLTLFIMGTADGKPFSQTIEADYSITKDGLVFAVITSATANIPSGLEGSDEERLANLSDQLFSFRFRLDRGALTIKDLKMPTQASKIIFAECRLLTGQYVAPMLKMDRWLNTTDLTQSSGRHLQHYPQFFPPDPTSRLPRELEKVETAPMPRPVGAGSNTTYKRIHGGIM
jgi:hypothetical protein